MFSCWQGFLSSQHLRPFSRGQGCRPQLTPLASQREPQWRSSVVSEVKPTYVDDQRRRMRGGGRWRGGRERLIYEMKVRGGERREMKSRVRRRGIPGQLA